MAVIGLRLGSHVVDRLAEPWKRFIPFVFYVNVSNHYNKTVAYREISYQSHLHCSDKIIGSSYSFIYF